MRLTQHSFDTVAVIGRGAFGEVPATLRLRFRSLFCFTFCFSKPNLIVGVNSPLLFVAIMTGAFGKDEGSERPLRHEEAEEV
jgi:hypothetical protein